MKLVMIAVYDRKAGVYSHPQYFRSNGEAIRAFTDAVNAEGTAFKKFPGDYSLHKVGEFNDDDGAVRVEKYALVEGLQVVLGDRVGGVEVAFGGPDGVP